MWVNVLLGILQGVFEWLPLSSEGITVLFAKLFVINVNPVDMALFLHLGTLFAVLIYFGKDWWKILTLKNKPLLKFLLIATIVSLVVGYPFYQAIKNVVLGRTVLIITGTGLLLTAFFHKTKKGFNIGMDKLAVIVGFLQGLSVIPGLSRSGVTIFGLSLRKTEPQAILKISYLMSAPVVLASSLYLILNNPELTFQFWPSLVFSFLAGILSLKILLRLAAKVNFFKFALFFSLLCFLGAVISFI